MTIKDFKTQTHEVKRILNRYNIKLFLFFGQFDSVIKPRFGYKFVKGIHNYKMKVLPKGHTLVKDYLNQSIEEVLKES